MKKRKHYYFVSYSFVSQRQTGFGSIEMFLSKEIREYADIRLMTDWLNGEVKDAYGGECRCVVLNYIPLKRCLKKRGKK